MHISTIAGHATQRHNELAHYFESCAESSGKQVTHECIPFRTLPDNLASEEDRRKRVDTRLQGLTVGAVRYIDRTALSPVDPAARRGAGAGDRPPALAAAPPAPRDDDAAAIFVDYTIHTTGARMGAVNSEEALRDPGTAMLAAASKLKNHHYRGPTEALREMNPLSTPTYFVPVPLSSLGRRGPETHRLMRYIASEAAAASVGAPQARYPGAPNEAPSDGPLSQLPELNRQRRLLCARRISSTMMAFSSKVAASSVVGLYHTALLARPPGPRPAPRRAAMAMRDGRDEVAGPPPAAGAAPADAAPPAAISLPAAASPVATIATPAPPGLAAGLLAPALSPAAGVPSPPVTVASPAAVVAAPLLAPSGLGVTPAGVAFDPPSASHIVVRTPRDGLNPAGGGAIGSGSD
jgi:hypothetical protein